MMMMMMMQDLADQNETTCLVRPHPKMMDEKKRLGKRVRLKLVWPAYLGSLRTYKYCCCEAGSMIGHNWNIIWDIIWYIIYIYMNYIVI